MNKILTSYPLPLLLAFSLILLLVGINRLDLSGSTEPREAGVAAEMLQDHDYLLPRLNGEPFLEKPPLSYWLQAASIDLFGYRPMAPRLPSVIAGVGCILLVYFFATRLNRSSAAGLVAGVLLLTMASYWLNARRAGQDVLLVFGITLTLLSFYAATNLPPAEGARRWRYWLGYVVGLGIATLAKGIIGLAIPGATIFAYLAIDNSCFQHRLRWRQWLVPGLLALIALLPLATWLYLVFIKHGISAVREIVWVNSVDRFVGDYTRGAHSEPFYYYLKKLPETFQPWTIPTLVALWQLRKAGREYRAEIFFACWIIVPFIVLSFSAGKRPVYLLALYPAAAMLLTACCNRWSEQAAGMIGSKVLRRLGLIQAALITGVVIVIELRLIKVHVPIPAIIAGIAMLLASRYLWRGALRNVSGDFFTAAVTILAIAYICYGSFILPHDAKAKSLRPIFANLLENVKEDDDRIIVLFNPMERVSGAARFYIRHPVIATNNYADISRIWAHDPAAMVLIAEADLPGMPDYSINKKFQYDKRAYLIVSQRSVINSRPAATRPAG